MLINGSPKDMMRAKRTTVFSVSMETSLKRLLSRFSWLKARITRTPVRDSRRTMVTLSNKACILENIGMAKMHKTTMTKMMMGMETARINAIRVSWVRIITMDKMSVNGARTMMRMPMWIMPWHCSMSLVVLVMRDAVPNSVNCSTEK